MLEDKIIGGVEILYWTRPKIMCRVRRKYSIHLKQIWAESRGIKLCFSFHEVAFLHMKSLLVKKNDLFLLIALQGQRVDERYWSLSQPKAIFISRELLCYQVISAPFQAATQKLIKIWNCPSSPFHLRIYVDHGLHIIFRSGMAKC